MIFEKKVLAYYNKTLLKRHDPDGTLYYFSKDDFPGLSVCEHSFLGDKGQRLAAYVYHRGEIRRDKIIIFEHGMGCGHAAYLREINEITERGYTVFTYDHTGTLRSEGEHIYGFSQSLSDLDRAVRYVRSLEDFKDSDISVIGHSWGGYSTMNITAIHPEISHVVALSGFLSPEVIQAQVLSGLLKFYRKAIYKSECDAFPDYAHYDARSTLKGTRAKALIIHSRDDHTCLFDKQFEVLRAAVGDNKNVEFLAIDGKGHNPNFTYDAVAYRNECIKDLRARLKKKQLSTDEEKAAFVASYDWVRMTEQDKELWDKIFDFISK